MNHHGNNFMKKDTIDIYKEMYEKYGDDLMPQSVIDDFAPVRARIQKIVDSMPKHVTFEQAKAQIELFNKTFSKRNKK